MKKKNNIKKSTKAEGIHKNESRLKPRKYKGEMVAIRNTCPFDSLFELIACSCNIQNFYDFIYSYKNDISEKQYICYATAILQYFVKGLQVNNLCISFPYIKKYCKH